MPACFDVRKGGEGLRVTTRPYSLRDVDRLDEQHASRMEQRLVNNQAAAFWRHSGSSGAAG